MPCGLRLILHCFQRSPWTPGSRTTSSSSRFIICFEFFFKRWGFSHLFTVSVITLLFKKGDRLNPANWRPITLLNVDYKICARALAARLLKVIHHVVGPDQTCGVAGRFLVENAALLRDLAHYCEVTNFPEAILSSDQEKAFDRLDCSFLFSTLSKMGLWDSFIKWTRLLYRKPRCSIMVNGHISPFFCPSRGVRQGCPLSPLIYVLNMEVLACNVRASPVILGIALPGLSTPLSGLSLYADDVSVIVSVIVSGLGAGGVVSTILCPFSGPPTKSRSKGFSLGTVTWRRRTGAPV